MAKERCIEDTDEILQLAKLNTNDILSTSQVVYFTPQNLHHNNYKLLELDNHLEQVLSEGNSVYIKGSEDEEVVICTETRTYDALETETSNSLLLVEGLKFRDDLDDSGNRFLLKVIVNGIFYDYLEVTPSKPRLHKLNRLLNKTLYKGPEFEDEINKDHLLTYVDLLSSVQASRKELDVALESMHVVKIDKKIRLLDFEYHFRILSYMLKLIDENSWGLGDIDYEITLNSLGEFVPLEVLNSLFDLYTEKSKVIDAVQLYRYKESDVCKFFAQVLLYNAGKFNFNEFLQAWSESVPEGMTPQVEMLYGIAIIDKKSVPNVIRAFAEDKLPENIIERFRALFEAKEKWSVPEIAPYIQRLTTDKMDVNAFLAKYARASTVNGVKYYSAKHANLKMPDCSENYESEIEEGRNIRSIKCRFCNSTILKPSIASFATVEFQLPLMKQVGGTQNPETEELSLFWLVTDMLMFENVGFSNTVGNNKYLTCADCEAGPIGYYDLSSKKSYVALSRVKHC